MYSTKIVTSFIKNNNKLLILKRRDKVRSMKGCCQELDALWKKKRKEQKLKFLSK